MKKDEKTVAVLGIGSTILLLIGSSLNLVDFNDVIIGVVFAAVLSGGYIAYQRKWFATQLSQLRQNNGSKGYQDDLTDEEALNEIDEWAERNYPERTDIEFHWNNTQDATVRIPSSLEGVKTEKLYAVWTDTGIFNQGIQVFYNCTTKEKLSHRKLEYKEQRSKPFMFCDYYREAKDNARIMSRRFEDQNQQNAQLTLNSQDLGFDTENLTPIEDDKEDEE